MAATLSRQRGASLLLAPLTPRAAVSDMSTRLKMQLALASLALVIAALYCLWLWQPERQVLKHHARLLHAAEARNWTRFGELIDAHGAYRFQRRPESQLTAAVFFRHIRSRLLFLLEDHDDPIKGSMDLRGICVNAKRMIISYKRITDAEHLQTDR